MPPPRAPPNPKHTTATTTTTTTTTTSRLSTFPPSVKPRQLSHLHSQLAQLQAHMADLENLLRMTAVQAEHVRALGGYCGGLFMAASKVLGEETVGGGGGGEGGGSGSGRGVETEQRQGLVQGQERRDL
ncbi:hypothetical protein MMC16_002818 [Acarospora aff. strigata]|nr:hypothetical protein [Acarospora aff. strigata]